MGTQVRTQTLWNALSQDATARQGQRPQSQKIQAEAHRTASSVTRERDLQNPCIEKTHACPLADQPLTSQAAERDAGGYKTRDDGVRLISLPNRARRRPAPRSTRRANPCR